MEGVEACVEVFTTASQARLYLNDSLVGEKPVVQNVADFVVPYVPGTLKAVTTDAQGVEHESVLTSASGRLQITPTAHRTNYRVGDLIYLDIDLTDASGRIESNADRQLTVEVEGGELLGFGSALPRTEDRFNTGRYTTCYGRSQAVVRADVPGVVRVVIAGEGVETVVHRVVVGG